MEILIDTDAGNTMEILIDTAYGNTMEILIDTETYAGNTWKYS